MSNIEKEFEVRLMIKEEQYFFIVTYFMNLYPKQQFLQNTNIYFDTDDLFLRSQNSTLRLRIINDTKSELTLKTKGDNGDTEISNGLTPREQDMLLNNGVFPYGEVRNSLMLLPYSLDKYHRIATLYNRRLEIPFEDYLFVVDKNTYGAITDYNIEIESKRSVKHAQEILNQYIAQFDLEVSKERYHGKAHRAIDEALNNH